MKFVFQISIVLFTFLMSFNADAYEGRCEMMGEAALSGYIEVLIAIGKSSKEELVVKTSDARIATSYYEDLGCEMKPLYSAIECFNASAGEQDKQKSPIAAIARKCLNEAGFNKTK